MGLKSYNPVTPTQRHHIAIDRRELWKGKPEKALTEGKHSSGGRNSHGRMTSRHRGGGHKKTYRLIDFKRRKFDVVGVVERIEYDPNRSAFIALINYKDGEKAYIIAPQRLSAGDEVISGERVDIKPGNAMPIKNMPIGTIMHNIELRPGKGGQLSRSAGTFAQLVGRDQDFAQIRLSSGEMRLINAEGMATIGSVSNQDRKNTVVGKAGRSRWMGKRPHVRGIAMNPVDHPHGGRTNGGKHWVTPWGLSTKGKKTRNNKSTNRFIVTRRNAKKSGS